MNISIYLLRLQIEVSAVHLPAASDGHICCTDSSSIVSVFKVEEGFSMTVKDLLNNLNSALRQFI